MSESFPELARVITELAQPGRIDIVRAKQHLLGQLGDGLPHPTEALISGIAGLFGAEPLRHRWIELPGRDSAKAVVTADHPVVAAIHADLAAREALAELGAEGMLIAAGSTAPREAPEVPVTYRLPGYESGLRLRTGGPALLSDIVRLPHRLRQRGVWGRGARRLRCRPCLPRP